MFPVKCDLKPKKQWSVIDRHYVIKDTDKKFCGLQNVEWHIFLEMAHTLKYSDSNRANSPEVLRSAAFPHLFHSNVGHFYEQEF